MPFIDSIRLGGASSADAAFSVGRSLRFNSSDGTGLTRTPSSAGNLKKWTWSGWVKRSSLGTAQDLFSAYHPSGYYNAIRFGTTDQLNFQSNSAEIKKTTRVFRDCSAWYHIVVTVDTQNATAADRVILYVNGVRETDLATDATVNLGTDYAMNSAQPHTIGVYANNSSYRFNGYMAEINFLDGQALTPSSFGETDSITGQWNPIEYSGSYTVTGRASDGTTWVSGSSNNNNQVEANAFNGIATTSAADAGSMYQTALNGSYTVTPSTSFTVNSNLSFQMYANVANFDTYSSVYVNGSEVTMSLVAGTNGSTNDGVWSSNFTGTVNNFGLASHPTSINAIAQVIVDGSVLINGFDDDGKNSFYLQFADNSGTTATTLGKDTSGNSNNYTPSNFFVSGSGSDSTLESPTNNFCTFNPLKVNASNPIVFSNGALQHNGVSGDNHLRSSSTMQVNSGKWYVEFKFVSGYEATNSTVSFGLTTDAANNRTASVDAFWYQNTDDFVAIAYRNNGVLQVFLEGSSQSTLSGMPTFVNGDVMGLAVDLDNDKLFVSKNGTFFSNGTGTQDPAAGSNPVYSGGYLTSRKADGFYFSVDGYSAQVVEADFGQIGYAYTPPTGFKAVSSKNLPTPTILEPNKHFETVLYTGNGNATGSQTNVLEFQPDWLWTKSRNAAYVHLLYDAVRGAGNSKALNLGGGTSPGAGGEGAAADNSTYGYLNSFDANGFSYTKGSATTTYFNQSSINYAVWNWNAGDSDGKTYAVTVVSDSGNKYRFDGFGTSSVTLDLAEGGTYVFDWSDSTAQSHPVRFSTTSDGTHGGGTEYTTGVVKDDSAYKTTITVAASAPQLFYYCQNHSGMGGAINTNSTLGSSNFDGSTQSIVKVNQTAGFSIVTYTGQQNASDTIGHGLGVKPQVVISKSRNATYTYTQWYVHHHKLTTNYFLFLNTTAAQGNGLGDYYIDGSFSSTVFAVGDDIYGPNVSNNNYVAYCFSEVAGYSKFGTYTGNGSTNGTFVFTGFRPAWVMIKRTDSTDHWNISDAARGNLNEIDEALYANNLQAEGWNGSLDKIDYLSNGFKPRANNSQTNASGGTYIYLAFAESPFKNARGR